MRCTVVRRTVHGLIKTVLPCTVYRAAVHLNIPIMEYTIHDVRREAAQEQQQKKQVQRLQLIVFRLDDEEYALPIEQIKEVVITPRIAKMPQTPPYIKGVANIRGNILAIMDLAQRLGIRQQSDEIGGYTLVVESEAHKVGILVKEVPGTLTINVDDIDAAADFIQYTSLQAHCLIGVVKAADRMILLMDMLKLLQGEQAVE